MADWEEAALVTYDANGGYWLFDEEEGSFETVSFYQPKGTYYLGWHEPIREGYYFYGWLDANGRNKVKVNLTGNTVYRALWHPAYNVTYHGNGGQFDAEEFHDDRNYGVGDLCNYYGKNYECISEINVNGPTAWDASKWQEIDIIEDVVREERGGYYHVGSVQEPYREGYRFLGWSGIATAPRGEWGWEIPLQADMEFYAIWGKEDVEITFDANGGYIPWGEGDEYEEFDTKVLGYDPWEGMDIIMADRGEEYYFLGWSEDPDATEPTYFEHQRAYFEDSTTLYAVWEKRVAIVFDGNGGTWTWEEWDEAAGEHIERIEETRTEYRDNGQFYYVRTWQPEREGYRFDGWFDKDGNLVDDSQYITLDKDEEYVFTAKWVKQVYVTYDANGGNWYDEREDRFFDSDVWDGDEGEVHIGWGWPNKDGASFVGWSLDPDADPATDDIEHDFDVTLHDDVTYFAIWCEPFTVTYDANGGLFYDDNDNPVEYKEQDDIWYGEYELWGRIDREGYEFLGWDTNPEATKPAYHEREHIDIKGETTFYAIWHKYPTVTYNAGEGQWGDEENPEKTKLYWSNEGEYYYVGYERPWREGYEFDGWVDENGNKVDGLLITMDQDYEFYASWSKWLNIRYYANGGQFFEWDQENQENHPIGKVMDRGAKTGEEYYLDGWMPERPGYRCIGWAYEEDPEEQVILENPIFFDVNDFETENEVDEFDVVFYAVWKKVIDVTYDFNGGTGHGLESETLYDWCQPGEYWVGWEWPYREGYEFLGWSDDPDAEDAEPNYTCVLSEVATYQDNGEENATVTFYAIWDKKVVVTFDAGEGEFDNGEQTINQFFRIGDILDWDRDRGTEDDISIWPTREGYRFVGWTFNGEDFKLIRIDEDITVVAKWVEVKTVTLDANGGTVWDEDGNPGEVIHITNNVDCTLPACDFEPSKEGAEFLGWYDANDELVNYITFTDDYTLTAKWAGEGEEDPHEHYGWGVTDIVITPNKTTVEVGEAFQIDHSATGVGYTFTWYRSTDQQNWTAVNEGDYWIEEILYTPGTYYYQLQIDNEESNIISVTVVE
nr:InlB B-repeat-containing protein [Lachnospiraceae bacterium]